MYDRLEMGRLGGVVRLLRLWPLGITEACILVIARKAFFNDICFGSWCNTGS